MRIAIASQNFRTVTGHAGKTRRFLIFEASKGGVAQEVGRLDLPKDMSIHAFHDTGPHPLDDVDAVIAGSAGPGFVRRMAARGVMAVTTTETDPSVAARACADGTLAPAAAHEHSHAEGGHGNGGHGAGEHGCSCQH